MYWAQLPSCLCSFTRQFMCFVLYHQLPFPTVQMSSTGCHHNCAKCVHFKKREIINRASNSDYLLFDRKTNWLLDGFSLNFNLPAKSHSFVYSLMYLSLRSKLDRALPNARASFANNFSNTFSLVELNAKLAYRVFRTLHSHYATPGHYLRSVDTRKPRELLRALTNEAKRSLDLPKHGAARTCPCLSTALVAGSVRRAIGGDQYSQWRS